MNDNSTTEQQAPEPQLEPCPRDLIAFKWAETLSTGEQSVLLASSLKRLQSMIDSRASVAAPVNDARATYEKAHEARYALTHAVHPDIVVLWFLALKSHWFDDPNNMFYGQREQAKAYLYKWVETGELADDNTTLEIATAMKFREWLSSSWTASPVQASDPAEGKLKHSDGVCICTHPQWDHWSWGSGSCAHCSCGKFAAATTVAPVEQPDAVEWSQGSL
jgi:hypothetical protein